MSLLAALKLFHLLTAILAFGGSLTYGAWALLGQREPAHQAFVLRGIRFVDSRLANPAFFAAGFSGVGLVWLEGWPWSQAWVWGSLAFFTFTSTLAVGYYQPLLRRQIAAFERGGADDSEYRSLTRQGLRMGWMFTASNLSLIALMVLKPAAV